MTNEQAVRAWLEDPMRSVKNGSRSIYSHDGTLFSYGPHYPLARVDGNTVLVNTDSYSATTASHASLVRNVAARMGMTVKCVDGGVMAAQVARQVMGGKSGLVIERALEAGLSVVDVPLAD